MPEASPEQITAFISRWESSGAAERANYQMFLGAYHVVGTSECRESFEQEILTRLVALNHERAAEEKRGLIRWLRPDYQAPGVAPAHQTQISLDDTDNSSLNTENLKLATFQDWPAELPAQVAAINKLIPTVGQDPETLAACFGRKNKKRTDQITGILATLKALGHIG